MKKSAFLLILILVIASQVRSQSEISFYHMGAFTPQSMNHNAAFFPDVGFYFSLPVVSGIDLNLNTGATYSDLIQPIADSDSVQIDTDGFLSSLKEGDRLSLKGSMSAFQFGLNLRRFKIGVFSNFKYRFNFKYPVNFLNYFAQGNGSFLGESIVNPLSFGGIAYREAGVSFVKDFTALGDRKVTVGVRAKHLKGILFLGGEKDASISMFTDADSYRLNIGFEEASFQTAGLNEIQSSEVSDYILGLKQGRNTNNGFGLDLGAVLELNDRLTTSFAINDLGFILWKQDTENYEFQENEIVFDGLNNLNDIDITQALEDSVETWTKSTIDRQEFRSGIGTNLMGNVAYRVGKKGKLNSTIGYQRTPYHVDGLSYGIGYTHRFGRILILSTTLSSGSSLPVQWGGGFSIDTGAIQLFGTMENILNAVQGADVASGADVRVGFNFMFAKTRQDLDPSQEQERKKKKLSPFPPEYELDYLEDDGGSL